jgi:hypothetical protein
MIGKVRSEQIEALGKVNDTRVLALVEAAFLPSQDAGDVTACPSFT